MDAGCAEPEGELQITTKKLCKLDCHFILRWLIRGFGAWLCKGRTEMVEYTVSPATTHTFMEYVLQIDYLLLDLLLAPSQPPVTPPIWIIRSDSGLLGTQDE